MKVKRLQTNALVPCIASPGDAGADLFSLEPVRIASGQRLAIPTGIAMEIPQGFVGLIWDKSGRALSEGLTVFGGVIDSSYRGEILVILMNASEKEIRIEAHSKIAQLLIQPVQAPRFIETEKLKFSVRGKKGFGSTGLKSQVKP